MRARLYGLRRICSYIRLITRFCQPRFLNTIQISGLQKTWFVRRILAEQLIILERVSDVYPKAEACDYKQTPQSRSLSDETFGFSRCRTLVSLPGLYLPG